MVVDLEKESYNRIIENLHDGLYFVDKDRRITYWNKAAERISGFSAEEVVGKSCADNVLTHVDADGNELCLGMCPLAACMQDGNARAAEVYMHHKDGHRVPVSVRVSTLADDDGNVVGGIELFTDISNHQANALRLQEIEKLAFLDQLTRLANRNYLTRELEGRLEEKKRYGVPFGVLFIDIDHFKKFNDTYGHDVGDEVLKFAARTFVSSSRPFDVFGRWGGEEFLAIIRNVNREELGAVAERCRSLIEESYLEHEGVRLNVTISVGATLARDFDDMETLVSRADEMMYESKSGGRNMLTLG